jgi:hypothetical protein
VGGDLTPHDRLGSADFKSAVSADFTIRAGARLVRCHLYLIAWDKRRRNRMIEEQIWNSLRIRR